MKIVRILSVAVGAALLSPAIAQEGAIDLSPKFSKGDKRVYQSTNKQTVTLPAGEQKTDVVITSDHEVVSVSEKGAKVKVTLAGMKLEMGRAGTSMTYDSANPPPKGSLPDTMIGPAVKSVLGKGVTYSSDLKGEVKAIEGVDALRTSAGAQLFGAALEDDAMKRQFTKIWAPAYTGKPIKLGDSWKTTEMTQLQPGLEIEVELTHTADSVKDGVATIGIVGSAKIKGDATGGPKLESVKATGKIVWNQAKHVLLEYNLSQSMKLALDQGGQKLNVSIDSNSATKLVEK